MPKLQHALLTLCVISVVAFLGARCSGDSPAKSADGATSASQSSVDALNARVQLNDMRAAAITIAGIPLHDYDTTAQTGKIDGKYLPADRLLVRVLALTNWTEPMKDDANKFHDEAVALLKALDSGDPESVKAPSAVVHDHVHTFPNDIWAIVAKDLPADAGGPEQQPDESTPAASTTAAHP